ncbi:MAG: ribonuclease H-like domain-containing protein [Chloroflexi bacterium]|nr:ribonuclease H-like domain-containing protein [Chloroflexota bacterium]MDA1240066.1 ribonuclease H-like domain-containing protein [Chloroflexota bacterium]
MTHTAPGHIASSHIDRAEARRALQTLIREIEARPPRPPSVPVAPDGALTWLSGDAGTVGYRELRYDASEVVGHQSLAPLFVTDDRTLALLGRGDPDLAEGDGTSASDLVFFDIETTGLGGAGASVFMVATARVEAQALVVRQYVSPSPADEGALVDAVLGAIRAQDDPVLVTYNGRTFDAPFLDERATMHRRRGGLQSARHLDLLHTVRRGYRGMLPTNRLADVESLILGVTRPEFEVAGAEIPHWYFRFVRTGSMKYIDPILEHNAVDVVALAALVAHLHEGVTNGFSPTGLDPRRSLALGRLAVAGRRFAEATPHLEVAASTLERHGPREDAVRELASVYRATGRRTLAVPHWQWLAERSASHGAWARRELAIHFEHHTRDLSSALAIVEATTTPPPREDWSRRRDRLVRKLERAGGAPKAAATGV